MLDLRLRYNGLGTFVAQSRLDIELSDAHFERGMEVRAKVSRPRSSSQNNLFHAAIEQAWLNQRAGPKFESWRKLKAWLLVRAGHCTDTYFPGAVLTGEAVRKLRAVMEDCFFRVTPEGVVMSRAQSVSFALLESTEFAPIMVRVMDIICKEVVPGVSIDELLTMAREEPELRG